MAVWIALGSVAIALVAVVIAMITTGADNAEKKGE
jgi:hypothetical protein